MKLSFRPCFFALLCSCLLLSACGAPGELDAPIRQFYQNVADERVEQAIAMTDVSDLSLPNLPAERMAKAKEDLPALLIRVMGAAMKEHGGLKKIKIMDEQISENGQQAQASVVLYFNDDSLMRDQIMLVRSEQGWKIRLK